MALLAILHILTLIIIIVVLLMGLKVMLLVIDALQAITILYILTGIGIYNVTLVSYQASKGLQPFIYPFGQTFEDIDTNFYYFDYRANFFSSAIVQVVVILGCILASLFKGSFSESN